MNQKIVVSLFSYSTEIAKPWADAGYLCYCVDIQHAPGETREGNIIKVGADVHEWELPDGDIAFLTASPPCDNLAVSGARWFKGKGLRVLASSILLFARAAELAEESGAPYYLENPTSTISTYWRKPDYKFDPNEYAGYAPDPSQDQYTKKTCLWTGGGFVMPEKRELPPILGSKMHLLGPSKDRANKRSECPKGFAKALFLANSEDLHWEL